MTSTLEATNGNRSQRNTTRRRKEGVRAAACVTPGAFRAFCTAPARTRRTSSSITTSSSSICKQERFHASILTLSMNGDKEPVLLRDLQMHPWQARVLHVDFQRVAKDRKIHMKVPLHFINAEIAPGVKTGGGTINHVMTELDIICLPDDLPDLHRSRSVELADRPLDSLVGSEAAQRRRIGAVAGWRRCGCRDHRDPACRSRA